MNRIIHMLRAACTPFVGRTFRGPRLRRYTVLALILGIVSGLLGAWFAQGNGHFEREIREVVELETNRWQRQWQEYVVITDYDWEYASLQADKRQYERYGQPDEAAYGGWHHTMTEGAGTLWAASMLPAPPEHAELARQAEALLERRGMQFLHEERYNPGFSWHDQANVTRLQNIVDKQLVPSIELYESPLGWAGTWQMIGLVSGGCIIVFLMVGAPLLVGVQVAQEVHENTLQPLTGTPLSARQLVLGLASGPVALALLLSAPQLVLFTSAALLAGWLVPALGFLVTTVAASALLVMLAQLIGFISGRRRAPGVVGMGLAVLLGTTLLTGLGVGMNMDDELIGTVAIPQVGGVHLLREAFAPAFALPYDAAAALDLRLGFCVFAFLVLAGVAGLALERRLSNRSGTSLRRVEALVAACVLALMALLTLPPEVRSETPEAIWLVSLGMLVVPLQVVLMGRVHLGDDPSSLRVVPLRSLMLEFSGFIGIHLALALLMVGGPGALLPIPIGAAVHLVWGLSVAALVAVRATAVPIKLPGLVWAALCMVMIAFELGLGVMLVAAAHHSVVDADAVLPLFEVSPLLGLTHVGLLLWTPVSLLRALKNGSAGLR